MASFIVLMSDEHNKNSSAYGHPVVNMPNMEKLARQETLFANACCLSRLCTPS